MRIISVKFRKQNITNKKATRATGRQKFKWCVTNNKITHLYWAQKVGVFQQNIIYVWQCCKGTLEYLQMFTVFKTLLWKHPQIICVSNVFLIKYLLFGN